MQETRKNCFGSKIRSTTLRQANTGKRECQNVTATLLLIYIYIQGVSKGSLQNFRGDSRHEDKHY